MIFNNTQKVEGDIYDEHAECLGDMILIQLPRLLRE